jgi:hypothetical protein
MKKIVSRLIWFPFGVLLVLFLVANRQLVAVSLDPLSTENPAIATPPAPLWLWLLLALLIGIFTGAAGTWMSGRTARARARAEHRELKTLKREAPPRAPAAQAELPTLKAE